MPREPLVVPPTDGRRRKGQRRREALLDATVRVIGRAGVGGVTQRAVAAEARVPPSTVLYYFTTVDDLLVATLTHVNDRYLAALAAAGPGRRAALTALAALICSVAEQDRDLAIAEYELWLLAARRPGLRPELDRWVGATSALTERIIAGDPDATRRAAVAAGVDGLLLRAATGAVAPVFSEVAAMLELMTRAPTPSSP